MADPAANSAIDLSRPQHVHLVGIGGAGMSAYATVLAALGHAVSGSDLKESPTLDRLRAQGVEVTVGHAAENLGDVDAVAVSTAIRATNPEVVEAHRRGLPVLRRAELLAAITATRRTVAVSGTHGKTTTSSMLALVLVEAGMRPSFIVGGDVNEIGSGAAWSEGEWLVVEADESDGTFVELNAEAVVVTSVEPDHLDFYGTPAAIEEAFARFLAAPGPKVVSADEPTAARLGRAAGAVTYGWSENSDYRIVDVSHGRSAVAFGIAHEGETLGRIELPVPGLHNAQNATAATVMALLLGAEFHAAASALARFGGVARRFQFRGEANGVTFVDDYAHNPGKVAAVLAAARVGGWRRVVCVFQPHLFSRTADLAAAFGSAFQDADLVVITDIYGAREEPRPGVTGKLIVDAIAEADPGRRVVWLPRHGDLVRVVPTLLRPGDLCLVAGAGDITQLPDELLAAMA
ncbi:MAG: UDP-N-acetylmuramate--L-alanine ligase [Acidimicrobiia bacterium]